MSIATPEGLELDLVLAGVGSRLVAALLDGLVRSGVMIAVAILVQIISPSSGVLVALWILTFFLVFFGYDIFFEVAAGGRTPGKRWSGLRVVTMSGGAVTVGASVVRNLVRIVDLMPGVYLVGIVLVALTNKNQRLGDVIAGTLVIRERRTMQGDVGWSLDPLAADDVDDATVTWDVSAVTAEEIAAVRRFLERRMTLDPDARRRIARELASRLISKVVGPTEPPAPEQFLMDLVAAKARRH